MQKLNSGLKKLAREANFLSLSGNLSVSFFGFVSFALIARIYPMEIFGQWVLLVASAAFIDMFRFGITNTAIIRFLSGAEKGERDKLIGSFILIEIIVTIALALIIWGCYSFFREPIQEAGYELFFAWYPFIAFITIPMNAALIIQQADLRFDRILLINTIYSLAFFLIVFVDYFFIHLTLTQLTGGLFAVYLSVSVLCIALGWDGTRYLFRASRKSTKVLLDFGKYTTMTLIGTNLLRSADTLIISLSPLGPAAVALYSIPMKLTELQQIPLRSFAATAFPKMSKESILGNVAEVRRLFYTYTGAMTYLFAIISLITFIFAGPFVMILGGERYLVPDLILGASAVDIVRILSIYGLLLPLERMTGVGLDSINKPQKNLQKVTFMVIANIVGDLIAVFILHSLEAVAVGSVLFTILGVWIGTMYLNKYLGLEHKKILAHGLVFYKMIYYKLKSVATSA